MLSKILLILRKIFIFSNSNSAVHNNMIMQQQFENIRSMQQHEENARIMQGIHDQNSRMFQEQVMQEQFNNNFMNF